MITPDKKWYQNQNLNKGPFSDTHVISIVEADTVTYNEPTKPLELQKKPRKEPSILQILCIHHQNNHIGSQSSIDAITQLTTKLKMKPIYINNAPPTLSHTTINSNKIWENLTHPIHTQNHITTIPRLPNYETILQPKFNPEHCYYTDKSFKEPT